MNCTKARTRDDSCSRCGYTAWMSASGVSHCGSTSTRRRSRRWRAAGRGAAPEQTARQITDETEEIARLVKKAKVVID